MGWTTESELASEGLWSARRRALTVGLVLTITLVAFEALAISTVMPVVARELGGLDLYGWVFSAFFLGNLVGIVVVGGLIDRGGLICSRRCPRPGSSQASWDRPSPGSSRSSPPGGPSSWV